MPPDRPPHAFKLRLDMTLVAFAVAGVAAAALLPARTPQASSGNRYALAISHGDDLKLAAPAGRRPAGVPVGAPDNAAPDAAPEVTLDPGARVLACRRVISVGPLEVGARCKPTEPTTTGLVQASATAD